MYDVCVNKRKLRGYRKDLATALGTKSKKGRGEKGDRMMDGGIREGVSGERKRGRFEFIYVRGLRRKEVEGVRSGGGLEVGLEGKRDERKESNKVGSVSVGWRDGWKEEPGGFVASAVSLNFGPWTALGGIGRDETGRGQLEGRDRCGAPFPPSAPKAQALLVSLWPDSHEQCYGRNKLNKMHAG